MVTHEFDPAEIHHGQEVPSPPGILQAALPIVVVVLVNLLMSLVVVPRMDADFLAEPNQGRRRCPRSPAYGQWLPRSRRAFSPCWR